jgi:hypothetical protein
MMILTNSRKKPGNHPDAQSGCKKTQNGFVFKYK